MKYYLGVDPGWTNLAFAWLSEDGHLTTGCLIPKDLKGAITPNLVEDAVDANKDESVELCGMMMERFVYYDGVHNPNSEQILMVTGQMQFWAKDRYDVTPVMIKAFDWKNRLSKHLYKKGFRNPSERLDKEFSLAAAEFIFPEHNFLTDHEADAACMAYISRLLND